MTRIPPSARRRRLINQQREVAHLQHVRDHIAADAEYRTRQRPRWDRELIPLAIGGPRKNADPAAYLKLWGVPLCLGDMGTLEAAPLLPQGGWQVFRTPSMAALGAAAVKGAAHRQGLPYLVTLAMVTIFSEHTLSEAARFAADSMHMCPIAEIAPSSSAKEWTQVGITIVNAWQRRQEMGGHGIGDAHRLAEIVVDFRDTASMRQIRQAELGLVNARMGRYRGAAVGSGDRALAVAVKAS